VAAEWRLLDYDSLDPLETQAIYHAVGTAVDKDRSPSTIIFCKPKNPLVCIGYHQELKKEVDLNYCRMKGLPIVRRILGGGAVYLDGDQLFYQVIAPKSDPRVPRKVEDLFRRLLAAPVKTYNNLGIPARYRAVNDIEVHGRKISGNGAGEVGEASILTGNIIFDFNCEEMVKVLKVPSEKFRDKLSSSLRERMTTIKKETGEVPSEDFVKELLKKNFEDTLKIKLVKSELSEAEMALVAEVEETYKSKEWLSMIKNRHEELVQRRSVKISGRARIGEATYKAEGGLIRGLVEILDKRIKDNMITGDFCFIPQQHLEKLEEKLKGIRFLENTIVNLITQFYERYKIQSPLVTPEDITNTMMKAGE